MLTKRLLTCAGFVKGGGIVCDVGTDHAYLPIYLLKEGVCKKAYACDIALGPLDSAKQNIERYGLSDSISLIQSDGLDCVKPDGVSDVIVAGMGGELIIDIISRAKWLKNGVNLVLQPNTRENELIKYLLSDGFELIAKKACHDGRFIYVVLNAVYTGKTADVSETDLYLAGLDISSCDSKEYILKEAKRLETAASGMLGGKSEEGRAEAARLLSISEELRKKIN